jgi:hypothetical protein
MAGDDHDGDGGGSKVGPRMHTINRNLVENAVTWGALRTVGELVGLAHRNGIAVPMELSRGIWSMLIGHSRARDELRDVDDALYRELSELEDASGRGAMSEVQQQRLYELCGASPLVSAALSDRPRVGVDVLCGTATRVTSFNAAAAAWTAQLNAPLPKVSALAAGLGASLPVELLPIFTAHELEELVCGKREIDLALLEEVRVSDVITAAAAFTLF